MTIAKKWGALMLVTLLCAFQTCAANGEFTERSVLDAILKRGELRVGLDAGYMPFEMRD